MKENIFDFIGNVQKWPSIGKKTSLRLVNFFLQKDQNSYFIQRLQYFLSNTECCKNCFFPKSLKQPCRECSCRESRTGFIMSLNPLDYFVFSDFFESLNLGFLFLTKYTSQSAEHTEKSPLLSLMSQHQDSRPVYVFFNKTLEERISFQKMRQKFPKIAFQDCSDLLENQESLYMLSVHESELFKEHFLLMMRS